MLKYFSHCLLTIVFACGLINSAVSEEEHVEKDSLQFIVIGDWGTPGSKGQKLVAAQMNETARTTAIDFIVTTGDNFYMKGVLSKDDPLWRSTYENIYSLPALKHIPWYVTLGNHDHMGNIDAQIEYGKDHVNWVLPKTYYSKDFKISENKSLQILFLDTSPFIQEYRASPGYYPKLMQQDRDAQLSWIEEVSDRSSSSWRIAVGHHPIYSAGAHGDTEELKSLFPALFERQKVNAYFAGHDHHLEHYQLVGTTHHFISGGGSRTRAVSQRKHRQFAASSLGFAHVLLNANCMEVRFINEEGEQVYQAKIAADKKNHCQ